MEDVNMNLKALYEKRDALYEEAKKLVDGVQTETRAFNEEEREKYNELLKEIRDLGDTIKAAEEMPELSGEVRTVDEKTKETQAEIETRMFDAYLRGKILEDRAAGNLDKGSNGAVIPATIINKIVEEMSNISPLFERAEKYVVKGNITIPVYNAGPTMAYAQEFTALTSTTGNFTSITLTGYLAGALCKISRSLINNSNFDLVSFVVRKMAETAVEWFEGEMIHGTSGSITGLSTATPAVTAASATAVTAEELIDLQDSVHDKYQRDAIWVMSPKTRNAVRKLKDGQGNYLLVRDFAADYTYSLLGKQVYVSDNMPDMATKKVTIFYGDPSGLAVKISEGAEVEVLRERYADEHAVGVVCWMEADCKIENPQKIAVLKQA
jgi:HK97 family phage major capsid protein